MRNSLIITGFLAITIAMVSCGGPRRNPGRAYMPDMYYSRAYETYASTDALAKAGIYYNGRPVTGTMARGDMAPYKLKNDSSGYTASNAVKNPLNVDSIDLKEAERLYQVNCGICHGSKLDGNGPLWNGGKGPYPAAPKNLMSDEMKALGEGTIFHVVTYGKGAMGSYASQLSTKQRWEVVAFVKSKQSGGSIDTANAKVDTVATGK